MNTVILTGLFIALLVALGVWFMWRRRQQVLARHLRALDALAEAGRALSVAELEVDALCELIFDHASRIVDTSTFWLGLFEGRYYHIRLWQIEGVRQPPQTFDLSTEEGIVGWMRRTGRSLLVRDFEREAETLPARPRYIAPSPPRSAAFVPLLAGPQVIGAMAIQSQMPGAFSEDHVRLLSIIANQAAAAIARARLLESERRRVKQLSLIAQVGRQVAAIVELDVLFTRIVELIHDTFGYYHVGLCLPDKAGRRVIFRASTHASLIGRGLDLGQGIIGYVAQTGEPLLINNVTQDARYVSLSALPETFSELTVPLQFGGQILGVLDVQNTQAQTLSEDDLFVLQTLADQVAIAIHKAGLYQAERRRRQQLEAVGEVGRAIVSNLNLDDLLEEVVAMIQGRFGYLHVGLFLVEEGGAAFRVGAGAKTEEWTRAGQHLPLEGPGLIAQAARTGEVVLCNDVTGEPNYLKALENVRAELAVPLRMGDHVLAVLDVQSDQVDAFDESDVFSLQALGDAIAVGIRNATLYASERRRRRIADTLRESVAVLTSTLDLDTVLDRILESLARVIRYDAVAILLFSEEEGAGQPGGVLTVRAARGLPQVVSTIGRQVPVYENGRFVRLREARTPLIFGENDGWGGYHEMIQLPRNHSCLGAPLIARDVLIGSLSVERIEPGAFKPEDTEIVAALASQAALAISNARLYEAEREQAWISTALLQVAEATTRAQSVDEVLATVVRITPLLSGVDQCGILLWEAGRGLFRGSHVYGLSRQQMETFAHWEIRPEDWWELDDVRETQTPVLAVDPDEDIRAVFDAECILMLPLIAHGQLAGVMLVGASEYGTFNTRRIQMIGGIANQAALAIESSQLAAAQREEAWVNTALLQVAEAVGSQVELSEVLTTIVRLTPLLVGVEACLIFLWDNAAGVYAPGAAYGLPRDRLAAFYQMRVPGEAWPLDRADVSERTLPASSLPAGVAQTLGLQSPLAVPIRAKGSVVGVMIVEGGPSDLSLRLAQPGRPANILSGIAHQAAIAIENVSLVRQLAARERLEQEIKLAREIQVSFLPKRCPDVPGWDVATFWQAARQVGGDFYDFVPLPRDHYALVIADVADKGVPAALFMALCRTLVRSATIGGHRTPAEALARTNEFILLDASSDLFVTMVMADLSPVGKVVYANAGHNPPLVIRRATGQVEYLTPHGIALGVVNDVKLENHTIRLEEGDVLVLYTDGVPDALNAQGEEFGMARLETCVRRHQDEPAGMIVQAIQDAVTGFVGGEPPFDDLTLIVAKRLA